MIDRTADLNTHVSALAEQGIGQLNRALEEATRNLGSLSAEGEPALSLRCDPLLTRAEALLAQATIVLHWGKSVSRLNRVCLCWLPCFSFISLAVDTLIRSFFLFSFSPSFVSCFLSINSLFRYSSCPFLLFLLLCLSSPSFSSYFSPSSSVPLFPSTFVSVSFSLFALYHHRQKKKRGREGEEWMEGSEGESRSWEEKEYETGEAKKRKTGKEARPNQLEAKGKGGKRRRQQDQGAERKD